MKRVGFFAGSFDPVHDGHIAVARSAVAELDLDDLYFMVEEQPRSEKKPVDIKHRINMIDIVTTKESKINRLELQDKQFNIKNTLPELELKFANYELYFVFGADVFIQINQPQWPNLDALLKHYIVIFERGNIKQDTITKHAISLGIAVAILPSSYPYHSSSYVRVNIKNKNVYLPTQVAKYIQENSLY